MNKTALQVVKKLFNPAVTLMNRLTYPRKMALVAIVFFIPLAAFLYLLISEIDGGIEFAEKEKKGVIYNQSIALLLQNMQQHRGMANAFLSGDVTFKERRARKKEQIDEHIKAIGKVDERLGNVLEATERWGEIKEKWQILGRTFLHMEAMESFKAHTSLITAILALMTHMADVTNLMFESDIETYYLMDTSVNKLPRAAEYLGQIRGLGAGALAAKNLTPQEKAHVIILTGLSRSTLEETENNLRKVFHKNPSLKEQLDVYLQDALVSCEGALAMLDDEVIFAETVSIEPLAYFESFSQAINRSFQLHNVITSSLYGVLQDRIEMLKRKKYYVEAGALVALLIILYLFVGNYFSIMNALSSLVRASKDIGNRDLNVKVSLDTKDEMSVVAASFNDMAQSLNEYTGKLKDANEALVNEITEHKRLAEKLKASEKKYRTVVDNALVGIYTSNLTGEFLYVNEAFVKMTEFESREEMMSENALARYKKPDERQVLIEMLKRTGAVNNYEIEMLTKTGKTKNIMVNVVLEGDILSGMVMDITERKRAEEALKESEERYRVMAVTAADAIITIDKDSRIIFTNQSIENIFGYMPGEVIGKHIIMLMPERLRNRHLSAIEKYLETGTRSIKWEAIELPGLHKKGHEIPLEIAYGDFIIDGKHFFTGFIRDITERKEAEKEKEYKNMLEVFNHELETVVAERTVSLMAMRLADAVRTPAAVVGWTGKKMIGRGDISPKTRENIAAIIEEAEKLEAIVRDFYDLRRSKQAVFSYEDINEIIRSILFVIERDAQGKHVELIVDLSEQPLRINAQRELMRMALFTMLRNAVESTPEGGRVTLVTTGDFNEVVFSVADTGGGIPQEALDKIFDPSYSAKKYRFGMGMPLIKQIVSEHLGEIEVESEIGKGTKFRVIFPVRWIEKV